jgi:hypothetical protein
MVISILIPSDEPVRRIDWEPLLQGPARHLGISPITEQAERQLPLSFYLRP